MGRLGLGWWCRGWSAKAEAEAVGERRGLRGGDAQLV
jgi:hypothetical protein